MPLDSSFCSRKIREDNLDVHKHLIPSAASGESKVFYHRYLAEFATGDKQKDSADKSLKAYGAASYVAELPPTHPIGLGLAPNFSFFYYKILKGPDRSRHLAKQALMPSLNSTRSRRRAAGFHAFHAITSPQDFGYAGLRQG